MIVFMIKSICSRGKKQTTFFGKMEVYYCAHPLSVMVVNISFNWLYRGSLKMGSQAHKDNPDEILKNAAFHQGLLQ